MGRSRVLRLAAVSLACLLALGLSGCEFKVVKVKLPTFFSSGVQELWFWRLDESTNQYQRSGHIRFGAVSGKKGKKVLEYTMINPDGSQGLTLTTRAKVKRDSITVKLDFARWAAPGWFRVSAANDAGESALSETQIYL